MISVSSMLIKRAPRRTLALLLPAIAVVLPISTALSAREAANVVQMRERLPEDEVVYLVMPDRFANGDPKNDHGGLGTNRLRSGFDPTDKGFYHGGDLSGLISKLEYVQGLGATAIWLTPVFKNKSVQGEPGSETAGYHGYWGTDFTDIDLHFGTKADYKAFVDAAHARGMKVYFDIVVNHTADVIKYRECHARLCSYRNKAEYPYTRRGGASGQAINPGFIGDNAAGQTVANFARLTDQRFAYTAYIPTGERHAKRPEWLNDISSYHNRGESTFRDESSQYGDFFGLDDVFTENPRVVAGMIDLYGRWIDDFGMDGFRIDTARHVNSEFWRAFVPAMQSRAAARGIPNFHIFGEVMEFQPGVLARYTLIDGLPAVNDFALQSALVESVAKNGGTDLLTTVFSEDILYKGGEETARRLVTLTGNHDVNRFARAVMLARPKASMDEVLRRVMLANAILLTARGVPALYYGDEQGFTGQGPIDQDSREDMFATQTASFRTSPRLAGTVTEAGDHFDTNHPLYREIGNLVRIRLADPALRRGTQISRASSDRAGLFAFSRIYNGRETLAVFNTGAEVFKGHVIVDIKSNRWTSVRGKCAAEATAPGSYNVQLAPLDYMICRAER